MTTNTKSLPSSPAPLVQMLRRTYLSNVEALAARLRPRIESGELAPWHEEDDRWEDFSLPNRGRRAPPGNRLEDACRFHLARTFQEAYLVLALAAPDFDATADGSTIRAAAGRAIAEDVLAVGTREAWYRAPAPASRAA